MTFGSLWLPVLLSALAAWIVSALAWTVLPHHKSDHRTLPDEDRMLDTLRPIPPGHYHFPRCSHGEMKDPAVQAKLDRGPWGTLILRPSRPPMGRPMALQLAWTFAVSFVAAYVARHALPAGAPGMEVARIVGTVSIAAYTMALFPEAIWWGRPWSATWKSFGDGVVQGLVTAAIFAGLWPS